MESRVGYARLAGVLLGLLLCAGLTSCAGKQQTIRETQVIVEQSPVTIDPGAVEFVWEPPLVDVIDVPPGLDPEGHYYRPAHQAIVEIRPGRWNYYRRPEAGGR
ncbi:MAG: hypothetical protein GX589_07315 [Deltaproteobacteria bacterium]|nr:hypothetical protein [Deltaproteobacteria bacterium]